MTETELEELDAFLSCIEGVIASLPVDGLHGFLAALLPWILNPMSGSPLDHDSVLQAWRVFELVGKMLPRIDIELDGPDDRLSPMVWVHSHWW